jgi:pimeloyl-ACP methyl ester carboxylesterase
VLEVVVVHGSTMLARPSPAGKRSACAGSTRVSRRPGWLPQALRLDLALGLLAFGSMPIPVWARKLARVLAGLAALVVVGLLVLLAILLAISPGQPEPIVGADGRPVPGSIAEKRFVDVHGARMGMFIKSRDARQPVLLYVHGGMPDYFLTREYPTGFEDVFTVVWWDQRGAGISYSPDIPPETLTMDQLVADVIGVTEVLRERFGQDKIYLMGHSGGTFVGIHAAARRPDLFHAYIGVAQVVDQIESERRAQAYMLERYTELGDAAMVEALAAWPVTDARTIPGEYLAIRDRAMHELGVGTMRTMNSVVTGLFIPSLRFREYTLREKIGLWRGKINTGVSVVWDEILATDLREGPTRFELPIYLVHGRHDHTCDHQLAREYLEVVEAPVKGFYSFADSAHSPMFEEPEALLRVLREDVLRGRAALAD